MAGSIQVRLLGTVQLERDGVPVRGLRSRKALALLGYLAVQGGPVPRERLVDLLWEDKTESQGRSNLSWVLNRISSLLPDLLQADRHTVQFQPAAPHWLDIETFKELQAKGDPTSLASAVELYRGEFLGGLYSEGCAEFELWVVGERERWQQRVVDVLWELISHHNQRDEYELGLRFANRLLALTPWQEEAHQYMMQSLARIGQRSAALAQYESCRRILAEELGVEPSQDTTDLYERIYALPTARRENLPVQPTAFVGREGELAEVCQLLSRPDCRLLTILGPGGIGKTRLALQAANAKLEAFLEGVCFVPLTAASSAEFIISAIADALQFPLTDRQDPHAQLFDYLRGKEMLLVLDSMEHLLAGTPLLVDLLEEAPEVKLLVTSRERLRLRWERCFELSGLTYPQGEATGDAALDAAGDVERYSALRLFQETARRARRDFVLSTQDMRAMTRLCQVVEGMPLAIELAAAWVKTHTCEEIAQKIEHSLGFLTSSLRDVPERQRSMQATFEHSWELLTPSERDAFARLSVFRRGFQCEAAGEIAGAAPSVLESLVDKSLLRFELSGRYEMHELVRQFAADRLAQTPEVEVETRDRHCAHYAAFLELHGADLAGAGAAEALAAIRIEMANVRTAWSRAATQARLEEISRGLDGLSRYYFLAGPFQEGAALIGMAVDQVRAHMGQDEPAARDIRPVLGRLLAEQAHLLNLQGKHEGAIVAARAAIGQAEGSQATRAETAGYLQLGFALWCQGEYQAAWSHLERALALARTAQLHLLEGDSLRNLGVVSCYLEDWAGGRAYFEQALRVHRAIGYRRGEGMALTNLGLTCNHQGDYAGAKVHYEEALRVHRAIGYRRGEGMALTNLGVTCNRQGDYAGARVHYEEALRISREIGDRRNVRLTLLNLGLTCNQQGDYAGASARYEEALHMSREIGDRPGEGIVLSNLGLLCHRQGDDEAALEYSKQALHIAQDAGDRSTQAFALMHMGLALEGLGPPSEAAEVYQQALILRQELGLQNLAIESLAGVARVSLSRGDLTQAQAQAEAILAHLEETRHLTTRQTPASGHGLDGAIDPFHVYLTCYRVLAANGDPRAPEILAAAHRLLQAQAAKIGDDELRRSYLENVITHREIVQEAGRLSENQ
jgi:DNA-binding SARP family transcriptional activator/predicted ATPase/Tfp pilus assembly protein PilF